MRLRRRLPWRAGHRARHHAAGGNRRRHGRGRVLLRSERGAIEHKLPLQRLKLVLKVVQSALPPLPQLL